MKIRDNCKDVFFLFSFLFFVVDVVVVAMNSQTKHMLLQYSSAAWLIDYIYKLRNALYHDGIYLFPQQKFEVSVNSLSTK